MENLLQIGMVVNQGKTELIVYTKNKQCPEIQISLDNGILLSSTRKMKALGIYFDYRLKWNEHIHELRRRTVCIINGLRIIRRKLSFKQSVPAVTAQALSIIYYASSAWLTKSLGRKEMGMLERIHLKALRVIVSDYR